MLTGRMKNQTYAARSGAAAGRRLATSTPARHARDNLQRALGNEAVGRLVRAGGLGRAIHREAAPEDIAAAVVQQTVKGPGQPLAPVIRSDMEARFGHDFGGVRIHVGGDAAASAQAINAKAYTVGSDIAFARGQYAPESPAGRYLLAHELAHVVQQSRGGPTPALASDSALEAAAGQAAIAATQGAGAVQVGGASGVGVARDEDAKRKPPAGPPVIPSSAIFYGYDSSGQPVYVLGSNSGPALEPAEQAAPELVVNVRGVRPPRPAKAAPQPAPAKTPEDKSWWDSGGSTTAAGALGLGVGLLILASNPVGWVVGLTAALAIASGTAGVLVGGVQLATSGSRTAEQEEEVNRATSAALGFAASPGSMIGGTVGLLAGGNQEGLEKGSLYGGLAEAGGSLAYGLGSMAYREWRFTQSYRGTTYNWRAPPGSIENPRPAIQQAYGLGNPADRVRANALFPRNREFIELSHSIPQRSIRGYEAAFNRPWNLTPMRATEHALIDPQRFQFTTRMFKTAYAGQQITGLEQTLKLTPPWALQTGYGGSRWAEIEIRRWQEE